MYIALYNHLHPSSPPPHLAPPPQSPHRGPHPNPRRQTPRCDLGRPPMPHPPTIPHEIEKSRKDVLDLTLRNPLLNFRPTKRRGVQVTDELSRELFALLVRNERVMYFLPARESQTPPANLEEALDPSEARTAPTPLPRSPPPHPPRTPRPPLRTPHPPRLNPRPTKPTTSSKPPSPCPSSTSASARPSGRPASRSRNRASTSSTSRSESSNGTSPTPARPSDAPR